MARIFRRQKQQAGDSSQRALMPVYVLGNGGALLVGLFICYVAVMRGEMGARGWDFFYYYSTSRLVLLGHGGLIFDLRALGAMQSSLAYPYGVPHGAIPDVYPPFLAVLLAPLAALPYELAYLLWMVLGSFILAFSLFRLEQHAGLARLPSFSFRLATMVSLPVLIALVQGQTTMLTLGLLTLSLHFLLRQKDVVAGVLLALAMIKPQYVIPFVVILLVKRRWRAMLAMGAVGVGLLLAPLPILGPSINGAYVHTLLQATSWGSEVGGFSPVGNRSFAGLAQLLLPVSTAGVVTYVFDVIAIAVLVRFALRSQRMESLFALAVVVSLLVSPHVLIHDLSLVLIPIAIMIQCRRRRDYALLSILLVCYAAVNACVFVSMVAPIQLSVPALITLGLWIVHTERQGNSTPEVVCFGDDLTLRDQRPRVGPGTEDPSLFLKRYTSMPQCTSFDHPIHD